MQPSRRAYLSVLIVALVLTGPAYAKNSGQRKATQEAFWARTDRGLELRDYMASGGPAGKGPAYVKTGVSPGALLKQIRAAAQEQRLPRRMVKEVMAAAEEALRSVPGGTRSMMQVDAQLAKILAGDKMIEVVAKAKKPGGGQVRIFAGAGLVSVVREWTEKGKRHEQVTSVAGVPTGEAKTGQRADNLLLVRKEHFVNGELVAGEPQIKTLVHASNPSLAAHSLTEGLYDNMMGVRLAPTAFAEISQMLTLGVLATATQDGRLTQQTMDAFLAAQPDAAMKRALIGLLRAGGPPVTLERVQRRAAKIRKAAERGTP